MIWPTLRAIEISSLARKESHTTRTLRPGFEDTFNALRHWGVKLYLDEGSHVGLDGV
jgi:hypothetical protein